jgi:hypothetical protein
MKRKLFNLYGRVCLLGLLVVGTIFWPRGAAVMATLQSPLPTASKWADLSSPTFQCQLASCGRQDSFLGWQLDLSL